MREIKKQPKKCMLEEFLFKVEMKFSEQYKSKPMKEK